MLLLLSRSVVILLLVLFLLLLNFMFIVSWYQPFEMILVNTNGDNENMKKTKSIMMKVFTILKTKATTAATKTNEAIGYCNHEPKAKAETKKAIGDGNHEGDNGDDE